MSGTRRLVSDRMHLRALETFAEIVRSGSATAAGRNLGMAQPASRRRVVDIIYGDRIESDDDAFVAEAAAAGAAASAAKRGKP